MYRLVRVTADVGRGGDLPVEDGDCCDGWYRGASGGTGNMWYDGWIEEGKQGLMAWGLARAAARR